MKNIAIFCDGTWQDLNQNIPTNVARLARSVAAQTTATADAPACEQFVYYDSGVGVGEGILNDATPPHRRRLGQGSRCQDHARLQCSGPELLTLRPHLHFWFFAWRLYRAQPGRAAAQMLDRQARKHQRSRPRTRSLSQQQAGFARGDGVQAEILPPRRCLRWET